MPERGSPNSPPTYKKQMAPKPEVRHGFLHFSTREQSGDFFPETGIEEFLPPRLVGRRARTPDPIRALPEEERLFLDHIFNEMFPSHVPSFDRESDAPRVPPRVSAVTRPPEPFMDDASSRATKNNDAAAKAPAAKKDTTKAKRSEEHTSELQSPI